MTVIYYLTTLLDGYKPRYVGQAENAHRRYRRHIDDALKSKKRRKILDWIKSRIQSGNEIIMCIINSDAIRDNDEIFYIANMREKGFDLLNLNDGGDSRQSKGYKWSPEAKKRKSVMMKGKPRHPNLDAAIKAALKKPEVRKKMSDSRRAHKMSPEHCAAISLGVKQSWENGKRRTSNG